MAYFVSLTEKNAIDGSLCKCSNGLQHCEYTGYLKYVRVITKKTDKFLQIANAISHASVQILE